MLKEQALQVLDELAKKVISSIKPSKLVVGLSGGADSTLVLLVANRIRELQPDFSVLAVHCIHGLDADDPIWFNHCTALCKTLNIELKTPKLNIVYGNGRSPEEVSRSQRYAALLSNLDSHSVLMLGHQADDQVESFFLALKRGSGPYGLSGMRFFVSDNRGVILRPLLQLHKTQIIEIIEALGFKHVFDISNTYLKFERNFIRLKVLPLLRERFAGVDKAVLRSSKLCAYEHDLSTRYVSDFFYRVYDGSLMRLDFSAIDFNDEALSTSLIRMFICQKSMMPPELSTVNDVIKMCLISPDQFASVKIDNFEVKRFKHYLYLVNSSTEPNVQGQYKLKAGESIELGQYTYSLEPSEDAKVAFYCDDVILDFDVKGAEKLSPLNRVHSREIKKLFAEHDVPVWERNSKCLVRNADNVVIALGDIFCTKDSILNPTSKSLYRLSIQRR